MTGWYAASSADDTHDDVEIDLGDGWWGVVTDEADGLHWALYDHWLLDDDESTVAEGRADTREAAKAAVTAAHRTNHAPANQEARS